MRSLIWRIARWSGMDGNPLRRRTDRIESAIRILLVLAFLIGAPVVAVSVGRLTDARGLSQVRAERAWHQVDAVVTRSVPPTNAPYGAMRQVWAPARWKVASGRVKNGLIPTPPGTSVGTVVSIWVNEAGRATGRPPLTVGLVLLQVAIMEVLSLAGVGFGLFVVAVMVRCLLNRRRLARWAIEWDLVGPRWTMRR